MNAEELAYHHHGAINQQYDGKPYAFHLQMVNEAAQQFLYLLPKEEWELALDGTWVHDLIEDCRITYNDVAKELGRDVAELSYILATPKGRNRVERHCPTYYHEIANSRVATFVKICDRIANVSHSVHGGNSSMLKRYEEEQPKFRKHLDYYGFDPMWEHLDAMFKQSASLALHDMNQQDQKLSQIRGLRDDIANKLQGHMYADAKYPGWHHQRFLRVDCLVEDIAYLLDQLQTTQAEVERLREGIGAAQQYIMAGKGRLVPRSKVYDMLGLMLPLPTPSSSTQQEGRVAGCKNCDGDCDDSCAP